MVSSPSNRASVAEALASLGKLRERIAAARNLEHLVGSRTVGPKVLAQVLPDVRETLREWNECAFDLAEHVGKGLSLEQSVLRPLFTLDRDAIEALSCTLQSVGEGPVAAKPRLNVERELRQHIPALERAIAHWEVLVEALRGVGVPMSIAELLTSPPDRTSERPMRSVWLVGATDELPVSVSPRTGLFCIAAIAGTLAAPATALTLHVSHDAGKVVLTFSDGKPDEESKVRALLPLFPASAITRDVAGAALGHYGATVDAKTGTVRFPLHLGTS